MPEYRAFLRGFLAHVTGGRNTVTGATGTRIDFVSFHTKGAHYRRRRVYDPGVPVERESPSSAVMVGDIRAGLRTLAEFPALAGRPVLVDECDPAVGTIYGVHDNPSFVVTLTEHYPTFLCALVKRVLDLGRGFGDPIELITTWAFYLEGKRFFEGNRALVTNENVELPILNAFRMLARLGDTRLAVSSTHAREARLDDATVDPPAREVDALATLAGRRLAVLLWHQADAWWAEGRAEVTLVLERLPFTGPAVVRHFRIDGRHSNAYAEWVRMGRPDDPSPAQLARLRQRQGLEELAAPGRAEVDPGGGLRLAVTLPIQGTSLLEVEPAPAAEPGRAPTRRPKPGTRPRPGRGGPGSRPATSRGGRAR